MFNILKGVLLLSGPLAGYFISGRTQDGALVGLGLAAIVVMVMLVIELVPLDSMVFGAIGAGAGLAMAQMLDWLVSKQPSYYSFVNRYSVLINVLFAVAGCLIAVKKKSEVDLLEKDIVVAGKKNQDIKILDTSVLIDGRIGDVVSTGFMSGRLVVPRFVLQELQLVADSSDATRRQRGRRGLDILKRIQEDAAVNIKIYDKDYTDIKSVDMKILELAKELGAKVATTDFNLNKVAALQGISVLNINDLAGALKSVVLPGDNLTLFLAKEGKEKSQAIGYLDDGTMVVVDEGRNQIGKRVTVHVNSILQTSAGRMIFARSDGHDHAEPKGAAHSGSDAEPSIA